MCLRVTLLTPGYHPLRLSASSRASEATDCCRCHPQEDRTNRHANKATSHKRSAWPDCGKASGGPPALVVAETSSPIVQVKLFYLDPDEESELIMDQKKQSRSERRGLGLVLEEGAFILIDLSTVQEVFRIEEHGQAILKAETDKRNKYGQAASGHQPDRAAAFCCAGFSREPTLGRYCSAGVVDGKL